MSSNIGGSNALGLLQQYDDHREIKDQVIKEIEQNKVEADPEVETNEKLLEEVARLRKVIEGKDAEILKLNKVISEYEESKMLDILPPRSLSRNKIVNTDIEREDVVDLEEREVEVAAKNEVNFNSPATSVAYTTSRITIASPNKNSNAQQREVLPHLEKNPSLKKDKTELDFTPKSKQELNNFNDLLEQSFDGRTNENKIESIVQDNAMRNIEPRRTFDLDQYANADVKLDINNEADISTPTNLSRPFFNTVVNPLITPLAQTEQASDPSIISAELSSPLLVDNDIKNELANSVASLQSSEKSVQINTTTLLPNNNLIRHDTSTSRSTIATTPSSGVAGNRNRISSNEGTPRRINNIHGSGGSNIQAINSNIANELRSPGSFTTTPIDSIKSDIPLFVKPSEFRTITLNVLTTLYFNEQSETFVLISVIDKSSQKEIFKFEKVIDQIYELDSYLRSTVSMYSLQELPILPDKNGFNNFVPTKLNDRFESLNDYFKTLCEVDALPNIAIIKILQFISTDTVISPLFNDNSSSVSSIKEGMLVIRKSKALGTGMSWRLRHAILQKDSLLLYNERNSQLLETIRLKQANIEILPNLPDDKFGTRNGFIITEYKKSSLSNASKYYLCTEKPKERELWVSTLNEILMDIGFNDSYITSNTTSSITPISKASENSSDNIYVTDLTQDRDSYADRLSQSRSVSSDNNDNSNILDTKKNNNRIKNLFPFKKLNPSGSSVGLNETETLSKQVSTSTNNSLELKYPDSSTNEVMVALGNNERNPSSSNFNSSFGTHNMIFGSTLDNCLSVSSKTYQGKYILPSVFYRCLEYLYKNRGLQEEGVFRLSGSSSLIRLLQDKFENEHDIDLCNLDPNALSDGSTLARNVDVNTVTGLLKLYLRSLPHLIFGDSNYSTFKNIVDANVKDPHTIALEFRKIVHGGSVPTSHIAIMYALFELLVRINDNHTVNKMNLKNVCIVFSPTLNIPINILQPFIVDFACIFKNENPIDDSKRSDLDIHIPQL